MPNESLIHADVFFFVTTIALVLLTIGLGILIFYGVRILRNVRDITDTIKAEGIEIVSDVRKLRANLRDEGVKWKHVAGLARAFFSRKATKATKK